MKQKTHEKLGIQCKIIHMVQPFDNNDLLQLITDLNGATNIHAILVQLPYQKILINIKFYLLSLPKKTLMV